MNSDVPAEILSHPPSTDIESSPWGILPDILYQHGLIWRQYEQTIVCESPPRLRLTCTFTDQQSFDTWQSHPYISSKFADVIATLVEVSRVTTPCDLHQPLCECLNSSQLILCGHGFGHSKATIYCGDCLGYWPRYRVQQQFDSMDSSLESWAVITTHVYDIWLISSTLENWAQTQFTNPKSEINATGLTLATELSNLIDKFVWYYLHLPYDEFPSICPKCDRKSEKSNLSGYSFQCEPCRLLY